MLKITKVKGKRGITLIALIVTIIVLLILAGVTIATLMGKNGILAQTTRAKEESEKAEIIEQIQLDIADKQIENKGSINKDEFYEILKKYGTISEDSTTLTTTKGSYDILISDIYTIIDNFVNVSFDTIQTGYVYSVATPNGTSWDGGNSYIKNVKEGEVYKINTTVMKSSKYYAVLFYNNDTLSNDYGIVQGNTEDYTILTDYEFTIPAGINKIIVSTLKSVTPNIAQKNRDVSTTIPEETNYVKYDGENLYMKARYNKLEDIVFLMKKRGNNNLFDFDKIYCTEYSSTLSTDLTEKRLILSNNTDFFSPHQVRAINNIDGDEETNYFLTGGNHDHNGVDTALCTSVQVFVDGKEVDSYEGYTDKIDVKWVNMITGHNTFKSDGTGRYILQETINATIIGNKINVLIEHLPLEDIYHSIYYGLQSVNTPYTYLKYIEGSNSSEIDVREESNSGNLACHCIVAYNPTTGDALETKITDEGYGTFSLTGVDYSAFAKNNKTYWALLKDKTVKQNKNDLYTLEGSYTFSSMS